MGVVATDLVKLSPEEAVLELERRLEAAESEFASSKRIRMRQFQRCEMKIE